MMNSIDETALLNSVKVMPIGADLVLREKPDYHVIIRDGKRLADVLVETAHRFNVPLALPVMDLTLEKHAICKLLEVPSEAESTFHFVEPLDEGRIDALVESFNPNNFELMAAGVDAVAHVAAVADRAAVVPVGMSIGPFSLTTKLLKEPITPVYMAGMGMTGADDDDVKLLYQVMELSRRVVMKYLEAQLKAGARFIFIAEPAANTVYISPKQMDGGSDVFDRVVMDNMREVDKLVKSYGASLIFHCCGDLTREMVKAYASLKPAVLSLGSPVSLPEVTDLITANTFLYGNLPSKKFYSDAEMTSDEVYDRSKELLTQMEARQTRFILGTECDVLSVPGCEQTIMSKVIAMVKASQDFESEKVPA